jgi:large subunit ribosomal protein L23
MITSYDIVKALIRTEKSTLAEAKNKYLFLVANSANKIQIKHAVEEIYKVKVQDVNTVIYKGKMKRVRREMGKTADRKKALVTLKEGQKIVVT